MSRRSSISPRRGPPSGFSILEVLFSVVLLSLALTAAVSHIVRGKQHTDWVRDKAFAAEKALAIMTELRGYVEGGLAEIASDLDRFDDGVGQSATLTIASVPDDPDRLVAPDHVLSGNTRDLGVWRWWRRISVSPWPDAQSRDRRFCTVRIFRRQPSEAAPGTLMAQVSGVVQSIVDRMPVTQVYDLYVISLDNCPGWWVPPDGIQPFMEGALMDLETKNPGLEFRLHWITKSGYGRNEEYAPFANEVGISTDPTPWVYVYPGRLPLEEEDERYYAAGRMGARINLDGIPVPLFVNDYLPAEPFVDSNGNHLCDSFEEFTDTNGNQRWDVGNAVPYAMADMQNHAMRWPDAKAKFQARVEAGLEDENAPTLRLLLDDMVAAPERYRHVLLLNMHGELIPMPPTRNYSDAARDPARLPGWRAVTHPELLRPARVPGDDLLSDAPRFRVYAYKTAFVDPAPITTQPEPYLDANRNGQFDGGEDFQDWNGNGVRDEGVPVSIVIRDGDFSRRPNAPVAPSLIVRRLAGGVDADGSGLPDAYEDWAPASHYPEPYSDDNGNGLHDVAEAWLDLDGNGLRDPFEPYQEVDGDGSWSAATEPLEDGNGNGVCDYARPAETFTDANGNGRWDAAEPYWDFDGNGAWTPPTTPTAPWQPWDPAYYGDGAQTAQYLDRYGEPFLDQDGDGVRDEAEDFYDADQDGVRDGGFVRGEMWWTAWYDAAQNRTVLLLHGTPLETPEEPSTKRGLERTWHLYDLEYIPCPTPDFADDPDRFARDLHTASRLPKNTARWTIEVPLAEIRAAFESLPGAGDGDAVDRILAVETRLGRDLTTGTMWPVRHDPANRSVTYAYFYADPADVPFSERYQFLGDPRHSPYADTDARGATARNGYNWYFDNFRTDGNEQDQWLAFDPLRLSALWMSRYALDVARYLSWLREAVVNSEAVFTSMTGFSFYYLSVGGDVGYDKENALKSIPMSGTPFGLDNVVYENTFIDEGTGEIKGSVKYARSNDGADKSVRQGGYWWAKPWLGEMYQDAAYVTQWAPWGNLRAERSSNPLTYRLTKRERITTDQQPKGTKLKDSRGELAREGCASFFMIGVKDATFHHKEGATDGLLVAEGFGLGTMYGFPMPTLLRMKHPFKLDWGSDGEEPPEFFLPADYPHYTASYGPRYYAKEDKFDKEHGSAAVLLEEPGGARAGRVVVTGLLPTEMGGAAFFNRYALLSLLHTHLASGAPATPHRVRQIPSLKVLSPTPLLDYTHPETITVQWRTTWARWDGVKYTADYPDVFAEDITDLRYVLLHSLDNGATWKNVLDGSPAMLGWPPLVNGALDPARCLSDADAAADETYVWNVDDTIVPHGTHLIRIEAYWNDGTPHYAYHMERFYVDR